MATGNGKRDDEIDSPDGLVPLDLHRGFVFPNRIREQRQAHGHSKLLRLASQIPDIAYIRLSKIERGETVPRADELRRIAAALGVEPDALLLDVDAQDFDIAAWAEPFLDGEPPDLEEERFAVLLAAALRARRASDPALTIAAIERHFGLPPVNLSRVENAVKTFDRWNAGTQRALLALFGVPNETELRAHVAALHATGALDDQIAHVANPAARHERTRVRIAEVAAALKERSHVPHAPAPMPPPSAVAIRLVAVLGAPLPDGLIADVPTFEKAEAPHAAGPHAFALKMCRATLGGGLPSQAVLIADPDRFPTSGGIAALREEGGWRVLSVGSNREGRLIGYSSNPPLEIALDDCDPARVAAIVSAIFP